MVTCDVFVNSLLLVDKVRLLEGLSMNLVILHHLIILFTPLFKDEGKSISHQIFDNIKQQDLYSGFLYAAEFGEQNNSPENITRGMENCLVITFKLDQQNASQLLKIISKFRSWFASEEITSKISISTIIDFDASSCSPKYTFQPYRDICTKSNAGAIRHVALWKFQLSTNIETIMLAVSGYQLLPLSLPYFLHLETGMIVGNQTTTPFTVGMYSTFIDKQAQDDWVESDVRIQFKDKYVFPFLVPNGSLVFDFDCSPESVLY